MADRYQTITRVRTESILETNSVIRNTYILLASSIGFSALTAYFAMATNAKSLGLATILIYFGLIFLINATRNSALGIGAVFLFTGFMGYTLGPLLNAYLYQFVNGKQLIFTALGGTGIIFFGLSAYALTTRKDFSYLAGFLLAGMIILILATLISIFFPMPILQLGLSAGFMLFSAGIILFETSQIIHGGERNYIMATVQIYVALYNMFLSLLQLLSFFGGQRE
ncbi:MAG: Bax inhibitor-1/YccA family protein [Proteobacteria bacterium]|nr:Bax inhibitor-1/YccA family protein [Pseudomonadota bacterium]